MDTAHRPKVVLLAEDSAIVRRTVEAELVRAGYLVLAYGDADGALGHLAVGERADALVTDIDMPGSLDGLSLAREFRSARPDTPVVYMSTLRPSDDHMVSGSSFVPKPFRIGDIAGAVLRGLSGEAGAPSTIS